jgi:hypothetical protein
VTASIVSRSWVNTAIASPGVGANASLPRLPLTGRCGAPRVGAGEGEHMTSRIGSGHGFPAVVRVRQVESGPAARSSMEARQAGNRAAAVVRISADARARAAAAEAEAQAAAAMPVEQGKVELARVAQPISDFHALQIASGDASKLSLTLEQLVEWMSPVQREE